MTRKMNLQMFAEAVKGKQIVYLYRIAKNAKTDDGALIAFTTENERTISKDADSTATKDGSIRTPGVAEQEVTATSILSTDDDMLEALEQAMMNDELVEVWEANLAKPTDEGKTKFKGKYFQGYLTEFNKTSEADGFTECELTFGLNGNGCDGDVTVTAEQQETAAYVFKDTPKEGA